MCSQHETATDSEPQLPPTIRLDYFKVLHLLDVSTEIELEPYAHLLHAGGLFNFFYDVLEAAHAGQVLADNLERSPLTPEMLEPVLEVIRTTGIEIYAPTPKLIGSPESPYDLWFGARHFHDLGRVASLMLEIPDLGTSFYRVRENDMELHELRRYAKATFANQLYEESQNGIVLQQQWETGNQT